MLKKISCSIIFALLLAGCSSMQTSQSSNNSNGINLQLSSLDHQMKTIQIDTKPLQVELVTTNSSRAQGLSGRQEIGADGMLFIFPDSDNRSFWMKQMVFAIDIIWINQGTVVNITRSIAPPAANTAESDLQLYPSGQPVDLVLELPAGDADLRKIAVGSQVTLDLNEH